MIETIRVAMWSGPRSLSTALLRAWENRADTWVVDEPLYAAFLAATGKDHPGAAAVMRSQPTDWRLVVRALLTETVEGRPVFYQKHMAHHVLPGMETDWIERLANAFLIREPAQVIASYVRTREAVDDDDLGYARQRALFDRAADRLGRAPPVIDADDVQRDPPGVLAALCRALGLAFDPRMLAWPAGPRASDGVWAAHWYAAVERSTGFAPWRPRPATLPAGLVPLASRNEAHYRALHAHRLLPESV